MKREWDSGIEAVTELGKSLIKNGIQNINYMQKMANGSMAKAQKTPAEFPVSLAWEKKGTQSLQERMSLEQT